MSISRYIVETIRNQFEVFGIRILQNEARDCYRELEHILKAYINKLFNGWKSDWKKNNSIPLSSAIGMIFEHFERGCKKSCVYG